ncbi:MAG: hypothetical protein ACI82G_002197 [Bradymonadia bacterium]|jgi:hypothetical protein
MRLERLIVRTDELIALADRVVDTSQMSDFGYSFVDHEMFEKFRAGALSHLDAVFGNEHSYYTEFQAKTESSGSLSAAKSGRGVLSAARDEMGGGWIHTTRGIVSAEIFADFLEMADHLLDQSYHHPAAVLVGSVLEEHLRHLCRANGIEVERVKGESTVPLSASSLNAELARGKVYNKIDQKAVTNWLGIRNAAAHGKVTEYSPEQVRNMLNSVTEFLSRHPK